MDPKSVKPIGYENSQDLLDEINNRFSIINKFNIILKKFPKSLTRTSLKDLIPEMITSRVINSSYAFIQFANEVAADKYLEILNKKVINGKQLVAQKMEAVTPMKDVGVFDLKTLYYNGLKPETKYYEIKSLYPNAKITFPLGSDKLSTGTVTLTFASEEEALTAFIENKMSLHGLKCHLTFYIKPTDKSKRECKFTFDKPDQIVAEIKSRFEAHSNCVVMVKNLPPSSTLDRLRLLSPSMSNCKINLEKKIGFIDYPSAELATSSAKQLNSQLVDGRKIRAFVTKEAFPYTDLSSFDLTKLHLTNLSPDVTADDVRALFPGNSDAELHTNTDGSCIGSATVTFATRDAALISFAKEGVNIRGVAVNVNFHMPDKVAEANTKKRALNEEDSEQSDSGATKKQRKSMIAKPIKKPMKPEITKEVKAAVEPKGTVEKRNALKRTASAVAKQEEKALLQKKTIETKPTKKGNEKKVEIITKPIAVANGNAKEDKKKPIKSVVVDKKPIARDSKSSAVAAVAKKPMSEKDAKKKPEVPKIMLPGKPVKRKFDQLDVGTDELSTPNKSRKIIKSASVKEKPANLRSQDKSRK